MKWDKLLILAVFICTCFICSAQKKYWVYVQNTIDGKKINIEDGITYTNANSEKYTITKLKYYISNVRFICKGAINKSLKYYLVDAEKKDSFQLSTQSTLCVGIAFTIGLDSSIQTKGIQYDGALHPLNDMYWAWNSGYVNFKLNGTSTQSTSINNKIEYHIGGFKDPFKTQRFIQLPLKNLKNKIIIEVAIDKFWSNIKIAENPITTSPGALAKKIADNFENMFSIKNED